MADSPPAGPMTSMLLGGYELIRRLGQGGMGEVWLARDSRLGREVAIKRISAAVAHQQDFVVRMRREAQALARLHHPSLVTIFDIQDDANGLPFIVMELLQGETVSRWMERHPAAGGTSAVSLLTPLLSGLRAAHEAGIIHRDLKPDNIFLERTMENTLRPKLIDFGIASIEELPSNLTIGPIGTPEYMAPEQITLGDPVGPSTDIWSFCVCLYAVAVGTSPFHRDSVTDIFRGVREAPLPFPRNGTLDGPLFSILARGTRKRPEDRYQTVAELKRALVDWQSGSSGEHMALRASSIPPRQEESASTALDEAIRSRLGKKK